MRSGESADGQTGRFGRLSLKINHLNKDRRERNMKHVKVGKLLAMLLAMCMIFSLAVYAEGSGDAGEATEITFWTFQELHVEYYEKMAEKWNEANPDDQMEILLSILIRMVCLRSILIFPIQIYTFNIIDIIIKHGWFQIGIDPGLR